MAALIGERREQDQRVERLPARAGRRHEPAGGRQFAGGEERTHARRTGLRQILAQRAAGFLRDKKREHRRAGAMAGVGAEVEQRIEKRIPAAPRDERRLVDRELLQRPVEGGRARIVRRPRRGQHQRGRADFFRIDEIAPVGTERGRAGARGAQQRRTHGFQIGRQQPRHHGDSHTQHHQRRSGDGSERSFLRSRRRHVHKVFICPRIVANPR